MATLVPGRRDRPHGHGVLARRVTLAVPRRGDRHADPHPGCTVSVDARPDADHRCEPDAGRDFNADLRAAELDANSERASCHGLAHGPEAGGLGRTDLR